MNRLKTCIPLAAIMAIASMSLSACGNSDLKTFMKSREQKIAAAKDICKQLASIKPGDIANAKSKAGSLAADFNALAAARRAQMEYTRNADLSTLSTEDKVMDGELISREEAAEKEMLKAIDGVSEEQVNAMLADPAFRIATERAQRWGDDAFATSLFVFRFKAFEAMDRMLDAIASDDPCGWLQAWTEAESALADSVLAQDLDRAFSSVKNPILRAQLQDPQQRVLVALGAQTLGSKLCSLEEGLPTGWMNRVKQNCGAQLDRINAIRRSEGKSPID